MPFSKFIINFEDVYYANEDGEMDSYHIPVTTNQTACDTQGFLVILGGLLSPFYNCSLCLYYVCVIKWNLTDAKITHTVEPFLHGIPWLWAGASAIFALASKSMRPGHKFCDLIYTRQWASQGGPWIAIFCAICIQMAVVYQHVWKQERRMINAGYARTGGLRRSEQSMIAGDQLLTQTRQSLRGGLRQPVSNSRKTLNIALAYVGAYVCTFFFLFINECMFITTGTNNVTMALLASFFYPLQGKI
jgi:hypothetical protein